MDIHIHIQEHEEVRGGSRRGVTNPLLLDHVLDLLHGGVDIVTREVEQDAERRNLAAPCGNVSVGDVIEGHAVCTHLRVLNLAKRSVAP